jgi:hypothetical protein
VTADYTDNATISTTTQCYPKLDPLVVALKEGARPLAWINLMLDDLIASLAVSQLVGAPAYGC